MIVKRVLLLSLILCSLSFAQRGEIVEPDASSTSLDSIIVFSRTLAIEILAWPFENLVEPFVTLAISPIRPPIDYVFQKRIIDKAIRLVTFGRRENIMINPVMKIGSGPSSLVGFAYRHFRIMNDEHRDVLRINGEVQVNSDQKLQVKYGRGQIFGSEFGYALGYQLKNIKSNIFLFPENGNTYLFADTSWSFSGEVSHPLFWGWEVSGDVDWTHRQLTDPNFGKTSAQDVIGPVPVALIQRGFPAQTNKKVVETKYQASLSKSTSDSRYTPTQGYKLSLHYSYTEIDDKNNLIEENIFNNNYHAVGMVYQKFILLGKKDFHLSNSEDKENKRFIKNINVSKFLDIFNVDRLKKNFLQRKVLVLQWKMWQMWDEEEGFGAYTGFGSIGNGTPLRGYSLEGVNQAIMAASMEYRFPLLRLVDGTFFIDYATVASKLTAFEELTATENFRGSWGLGMRMRKPNLFISRLQLGFAGFHGVKLNLTVSPAY